MLESEQNMVKIMTMVVNVYIYPLWCNDWGHGVKVGHGELYTLVLQLSIHL